MARDYKDAKDLVTQPVCATGETTHSLTASHRGSEDGTGRGTPIVIDRAAFNQGQNAQYEPRIEQTETMDTLVSRGPHAVGVPIPYRKSKRAATDKDDETWVEADKANTINLFDLGDTRTTHAVVEPIKPYCADVAPTITSSGPPFSRTGNERTEAEALVKCDTGDQSPHVAYVQGVDLYNQALTGEVHCPLRTAGGHGAPAVMQTPMAVRRLTPEECEALQGFPKGYSRIPWKGKPAEECPDGPRYKACGNSMAVPVMAWVGQRIAEVEKLLSEQPKP